MNCPSCGTEQSADATYCQNCGTDLAATSGGAEQPRAAAESKGETRQASTPNSAAAQDTAAPARQQASGSAGWGTTRKAAVVGSVLVGGSVLLPWATAINGRVSADGMATEFGSFVLVAAAIALVPALLTWGGGFGWLAMLVTGLSGAATGYIGVVTHALLSETATLGTMSIEGQSVPLAALEPGVGPLVAAGGGGLLVIAALGGIVGTLFGS